MKSRPQCLHDRGIAIPFPPCNVDGKLRPPIFFATIHNPNIVMGAGGGIGWMREQEKLSLVHISVVKQLCSVADLNLDKLTAYEVQTRLTVNVRSEESLT